jgi:predicted enzyme related to lactoylglutathione lyase
MARVTGIGGVFFKARDPQGLSEWYRTHLGMEVTEWGGVIFRGEGTTTWNLFDDSSTYFAPGFMVNYRVDDLDGLLAGLREAGCDVDEKVEESEYGKFGWVMDPEGNRLELWQPPDGG